MNSIAVIGAGITGVTTAYALMKRGLAVTLYDPQRYAAMETSYANGGQLSASNAEVWNALPTVIKGLRWMLKKNAPLLVNPLPTWHKISWFSEFLAAIPQHDVNTIHTTQLAIAAREHLYAWAAAEQIDFDLERRGILHIYRDAQSFTAAGRISQLLAQGGLERRAVGPQEMREIEPHLEGHFYGGYFTPSDATGDIHLFTKGLAAACERQGVEIAYQHQLLKIHPQEQGVQLTLRQGEGEVLTRQHDQLVICAGVASRQLAAQVGDRLNIYPVKGYAITLPLKETHSQNQAPWVSLLDEEAKLVSSRLGPGRLRVAGTAEFNGQNLDIRADRIQPLVDWVRRCFPHVSTEEVIPWAGLRPMLPNMLPRIGAGRHPRIFYNTGHGHLGWTLAPATAELLADQLISTRTGHGLVSSH